MGRGLGGSRLREHPFWFYWAQLPLSALPASLLIPLAGWAWWSKPAKASVPSVQSLGQLGLAWVLGGVMLLSMARFKRADYLAPILPGLALWLADVTAKQQQTMEQLSWKQALLIGIAQAIALIPGTSRSGITMTAALMLGLDRVSAARFSFLLSIPIIVLSGGYQASKLLSEPTHYDINAIALGTGLSFISAFICIHLFLKVIERMGMLPFVIYRLILGITLLVVLSSTV